MGHMVSDTRSRKDFATLLRWLPRRKTDGITAIGALFARLDVCFLILSHLRFSEIARTSLHLANRTTYRAWEQSAHQLCVLSKKPYPLLRPVPYCYQLSTNTSTVTTLHVATEDMESLAQALNMLESLVGLSIPSQSVLKLVPRKPLARLRYFQVDHQSGSFLI